VDQGRILGRSELEKLVLEGVERKKEKGCRAISLKDSKGSIKWIGYLERLGGDV